TLAATSLYRMMAQRIGREYSHSQAKTVFRNLLDLSGKVEVTATSGGAGIEEIDPASQELAVLQEPKWGADGRPVHELDSHLRTQPCQSVRLPHRVAAARRGVEANAVGVDALELPRDAGADRRSLGCGIGYAGSCMAEKDRFRPCRSATPKWPPNGLLRRHNRKGFLARHGSIRKCFAPASTLASRHTISKPYSCRTAPCASTPQNGAGPSLCK